MDKRFINFQPKLWYLSGIIVALRLQYLYGNTLVNCLVGMDKSFIKLQPNAGSRTDFWDKKSSDFSGEIFRGRNYCPRTACSGQKIRSILSNHVISWYGSRAVGFPLGREITSGTCSLLGNEGTPPDFERFFLEKRPWKHFLQMF